MVIIINTKRKRTQHPIYIKLGKAMKQKYDLSECDFPSNSEIMLEALVHIKGERKKWTPIHR